VTAGRTPVGDGDVTAGLGRCAKHSTPTRRGRGFELRRRVGGARSTKPSSRCSLVPAPARMCAVALVPTHGVSCVPVRHRCVARAVRRAAADAAAPRLARPAIVASASVPLWDAGFVIGHGARTVRGLAHAHGEDLDASLLCSTSATFAGRHGARFATSRPRDLVSRQESAAPARSISSPVRRVRRTKPGAWSPRCSNPTSKTVPAGLRDVHCPLPGLARS